MNYFQSAYILTLNSALAETRQSFWIILSPTCNKTFVGLLFICIVAVLFLGMSNLLHHRTEYGRFHCDLFSLFYLFKMSLNIISLSGLILALGMMIDSSIIVTENISQYRERGYSLKRACITGTSEVVTPMLSSSLTTIAVFVPLIFMSGIAGAIFYDQAFSVTVGLMVFYFTGIMLPPVLYMLVYRTGLRKSWFSRIRINNPIKDHTLDRCYDAGLILYLLMKRQAYFSYLVSIAIVCIHLLFQHGKRAYAGNRSRTSDSPCGME